MLLEAAFLILQRQGFRSSPSSSHPFILSICPAPLGKEVCPSRPMWLEELLLYFCSQASFKGKFNPPGMVLCQRSPASTELFLGRSHHVPAPKLWCVSTRAAAHEAVPHLPLGPQERCCQRVFCSEDAGRRSSRTHLEEKRQSWSAWTNPHKGAFGGEHILGFNREAWEEHRAPSS